MLDVLFIIFIFVMAYTSVGVIFIVLGDYDDYIFVCLFVWPMVLIWALIKGIKWFCKHIVDDIKDFIKYEIRR